MRYNFALLAFVLAFRKHFNNFIHIFKYLDWFYMAFFAINGKYIYYKRLITF